jgi:ABC-type glycerol-3-phosphate transport system permease component
MVMKILSRNGYSKTLSQILILIKELPPHLLFLVMALINLFPFFFIVISSLKTNPEYFKDPLGFPSTLNFDSFRILIFERPFLRQLINSLFVSGISLVITLAISIPAAYAYARIKFRARDTLFDFTTALMGIPLVVTIVPLFVLMSRLHLLNSYPSAIIIYVGFTMPFSIYVLTGFFQSIPSELIDAARVDGAEHPQIIRHVIFPLSKAPIVTLAIVNGLWVWNELFIALLFLQRETSTTLMASLARGTSRDVRNVPLIMAGCAIASIPSILFLFFGQKYFIKGFLGGTSKFT